MLDSVLGAGDGGPGLTARAPIRVLIAEDDDVVRSALSAIVRLEPKLELVGAAPDGREGAAIAKAEQPDVALVDIRMPFGGAVCVRAIHRVSSSTRVLVLSASDDRATVLEMLEAGAVGYLVNGASV